MLHVKNKHLHASIQPPKHPQCVSLTKCLCHQFTTLRLTSHLEHLHMDYLLLYKKGPKIPKRLNLMCFVLLKLPRLTTA